MTMTLLAGVVSLAVLAIQDPVLGPGSPAPRLEVKAWVKGDPVASLEKDQTYVVEFWATWCGPCLESIPLLTEVANKHPDVQVIGISILEDNDKEQVQDFVARMGDKMDYSVAYGGNKDGMARSWLAAAKQSGIPCAFLVKNNTVLWVGHPSGLERNLDQVIKDEFDVSAARRKFDDGVVAREAAQKLQAEVEACEKLYDSGETQVAKARLAEVEKTPQGKAAAADLRFQRLAIEDSASWRKVATERMNGTQDARTNLAMFIEPNAVRAPEQCKWLLAELTSDRYPPDWYPWLCGARMFRQLKDYDKAMDLAARSREVILEFRRANPDAPKGNALDVIKSLEEQIAKEKRGSDKRAGG